MAWLARPVPLPQLALPSSCSPHRAFCVCVCTGRPPYTGINHLQLLQNIERGEGGRLPDSVAAALSTSCKQVGA